MISMCRYYNGKILQAKVSAVYLPKGSCAERKRVPVTENQLQKRYNNNKDDIGYLKKNACILPLQTRDRI